MMSGIIAHRVDPRDMRHVLWHLAIRPHGCPKFHSTIVVDSAFARRSEPFNSLSSPPHRVRALTGQLEDGRILSCSGMLIL